MWQGQLDTLRAILRRFPSDAEFSEFEGGSSVAMIRADLLLYERAADSLLQMPELSRPNLASGEHIFRSGALYRAWAYQIRGDQAAARAAFDSARVHLDSWLREHPDDSDAHGARGIALAGVGRRADALQEARWLEQSVTYREDANSGTSLAVSRALILAQVGEADAAIDELERLLAKPSGESVQTLRLDPGWDPIRDHPRFKALLAKYSY
jgi:serine/threonine-protein kinase